MRRNEDGGLTYSGVSDDSDGDSGLAFNGESAAVVFELPHMGVDTNAAAIGECPLTVDMPLAVADSRIDAALDGNVGLYFKRHNPSVIEFSSRKDCCRERAA